MSLGRRRRPPTPPFVANELWRRAGEVPSFHIAPARTGTAVDLISGTVLGGGSVNSAAAPHYFDAQGNLVQPVANTPVISFGFLGTTPGLRIRSAAQYYAPYSVVDSNWTSDGFAVPTYNLGLNVFGLFSGASVASAGANWHSIRRTGISLTAGATHYFLVYYRAGTSGRVQIAMRNNTAGVESSVRGIAGSVAAENQSAGTMQVTSQALHPDGQTRFIQGYFIPAATSGDYWMRLGPDSGTAGQTVIVLGAQLANKENASFAVTGASAVTSSTSDVITITGAAAARIINSQALTVYIDAIRSDTGNYISYPNYYSISSGSSANLVSLYGNQGTQVLTNFSIQSGGVSQTDYVQASIAGTTSFKAVQSLTLNRSIFGANGTLATTDTSVTMPVGLNRIGIGSPPTSGEPADVTIREFAIFAGALDASRCLSLIQ